jgi:hypothetical protein
MAMLGSLGARRGGKDLLNQYFLDEAIAQSPPGTWPLPVLQYLRHDIPTHALLEAAVTEAQKTEAHTFVALELLHRGEPKPAREHLEWVRDHGTSRSIATDLARATLEKLDPPQRLSRASARPGA